MERAVKDAKGFLRWKANAQPVPENMTEEEAKARAMRFDKVMKKISDNRKGR